MMHAYTDSHAVADLRRYSRELESALSYSESSTRILDKMVGFLHDEIISLRRQRAYLVAERNSLRAELSSVASKGAT